VTEIHYQPSPTAPPLHPALLSALHGSLLVTCTDHFRLSFYHISATSTKPTVSFLRPFRTIRSQTSWFPAALTLSPIASARPDGPMAMRCSLAHAVPVYPDSWSVAVQEIDLAQTSAGWTMDSTRTLSALSALTTPEDAAAWGGVGIVRGKVTAIGLSERWVCIGTADNEVMCWQVPQSRSEGRLRLGRSMMGAHWGEVSAVACHGGQSCSLRSLFPSGPGRSRLHDSSSISP
jgi:hypothetical protein